MKMKPIDIHVHMVGNGKNGSGCWLRLASPFHKLLARYMLHLLGLPARVLADDLEEIYISKLKQLVQTSGLEKVVLLAQEQVYDEDGMLLPKLGSLHVPNSVVLELARQHPEFLAGVSIHPARKDALDELEKCLAQGAVLMKCLPPVQNINCSDKRYRPFWERMAQAGLPLLAHTGGELSLPVVNQAYADPRLLTLPLECGVTVIAAHCATNALYFDANFRSVFGTMLERYPNLYGDNSGLNTPVRSRHFKHLLEPPIVDRIIHGSDFPIPISAHWAWLRGLITLKQCQACQAEPNLLERDLMIKRSMGFPHQTFTRMHQLLRL